MPRLLMLTHRVPFPPDRGDRVRSWNLLSFLSRHYDVSLACVSEEPATDAQWSALRSVTRRCVVRRIGPVSSRMRGLASLAAGGAATPGAFFRNDLLQTVVGWHDEQPFDVVLTFCTGMFRYARELMALPNPPARHVLDLVDVDSEKWAQLAPAAPPWRRWVYATEARRLRPIEAGVLGPVDAMTVVSEREATLYGDVVRSDAPLHVVENGVDLEYWRPLPDCLEPVLGFAGVLDYEPNVDGLQWFVRDVLPRVRARVPNARLRVVGRRPSSAVMRLGSAPDVEIIGGVPDVRPELAQAAAMVAPLRIARGVQNKVLEAMASARAVVATKEAAQGVDAWPGRELLVGESVPAFAEACVLALTDGWRRRSLAAAARRRVEERYRWNQTLVRMLEALEPGATAPRAVRWAA